MITEKDSLFIQTSKYLVTGIQLMTDLSETIIQHFSAMFPLENKQAQIAMTTVLLNYAVVYTSRKISKESQNIVMSLCLLFMQGKESYYFIE